MLKAPTEIINILLDLDGDFFMARAEVTNFARFGKCEAEKDCTCQIPRYGSEGSR